MNFAFKNEELCIKNEEFCIENGELCRCGEFIMRNVSTNEELKIFVFKNEEFFAQKRGILY